MRKKILLSLIILFSSVAVLNATDISTYLPSLHQAPILPSINGFGKLSNADDIEPIRTLKKALSTEYSLNWTELYFEPSKKKALAHINNDLLADLLPVSSMYFSEPVLNSNVYSVSIYIEERNMILDMLLDQTTLKIMTIEHRVIDKNN